jgi:hypothetical protein
LFANLRLLSDNYCSLLAIFTCVRGITVNFSVSFSSIWNTNLLFGQLSGKCSLYEHDWPIHPLIIRPIVAETLSSSMTALASSPPYRRVVRYLSPYSDGLQAGKPEFDSRKGQETFLFSTLSRPNLGPAQPLTK